MIHPLKNAHAMSHHFLRCFSPPFFLVPTPTSIDLVASPVFVVFFCQIEYFFLEYLCLCAPFGSPRRFSNALVQILVCIHLISPVCFSSFLDWGHLLFPGTGSSSSTWTSSSRNPGFRARTEPAAFLTRPLPLIGPYAVEWIDRGGVLRGRERHVLRIIPPNPASLAF